MSISSVSEACRTRFKRLIMDGEAELPLIPAADPIMVQFPNLPFERPEEEPYVQMHLIFGKKNQASMGRPGNNRYRQLGNLVAQIWVPMAIGSGRAEEIGSRIEKAFQAKTELGVKYLTPTPSTPGLAGTWWLLEITCPFYADTFE